MSATDQPWLHELVTVLAAPTVVLGERGGQLRADGSQGILHADVRVLSQALLTVGAAEPTPIGGGLCPDGTGRFVAVPRALGDPGTVDPTVWVERHRTVTPGTVREEIELISAADGGVDTEIVLDLTADLAELSQIKQRYRGAPVAFHRAGDRLEWGRDAVRVALTAPHAELDARTDGARLRWPVRLAGRGRVRLGWQLTVTDPTAVIVAAPDPAAPQVRVEADDPRIEHLVTRSLTDLAALRVATTAAPDEPFLAAGAPWFCTLFGRDSIWAARLLLPFGWQLAASTLRALAALQGRAVDPDTAEAPGKIPHELRRKSGTPGPSGLPARYYGTIDATPLWICLLHDAWRWGMPTEQVRALLPALRAALSWLAEYGDPDGDCFLEYIDESGRGLANQGWKDSGDSVRFADGRIATGPIALCEVQGYAYEAATRGADLLDALGEPGAATWRAWADKLAAAFRAAFWVRDETGPYPALALDGSKLPVDSLTSNIAHLLGTGLLTPAEEALVAARLTGPDLNSGYGLRTMSAANAGYSPLSYHCGSVWTHDTAIAVRNLVHSGHSRAAATLADGLLAAGARFDWRMPELYSGHPAGGQPQPVAYPASCAPQAWAAAAAGALIQATLGLSVDVPAGRYQVDPPGLGATGTRLAVTGLVAGDRLLAAGVDRDGTGYLRPATPDPAR